MNPFRISAAFLKAAYRGAQFSHADWALVFLTGALLFVFSLPNAMALRKLLLLAVCLLAFRQFWRGLKERTEPLVLVFSLIAILQLWMLYIAVFVSNNPWGSLSEWKGQWLTVVMCFVSGIGLARLLARSQVQNARMVLALVVVIPVTGFLCINAITLLFELSQSANGQPAHYGLAGQKGIIGYLLVLLAPLVMADILSRQKDGTPLQPFSWWFAPILMSVVLFSLLAIASRNGAIILILAFLLMATVAISQIRKIYSKKSIVAIAVSSLLLIAGIAFVVYKVDPRWQTFSETILVAWDIDRDRLWLSGDGLNVPLTPNGQPVDISQYYRIAWLHEGWRMLMAHPWGVEIARDVFPKLVLEQYGQAGMAHTHNSWLDLGLQVGLPGLLLWGGLMWLIARKGWIEWRRRGNPLGAALWALVVLFAVHGLIDSVFRDHMIEQFMLVAGLLLGFLSFEKGATPQSRS